MLLRSLALVAAAALAAPAAHAQPAPAPAVRDPGPADRAMIAAAIYHDVKRYFAHWEGVPEGYDFEARFRAYLDEAMAAPDRQGSKPPVSRPCAVTG